jgi:hypothetical protein
MSPGEHSSSRARGGAHTGKLVRTRAAYLVYIHTYMLKSVNTGQRNCSIQELYVHGHRGQQGLCTAVCSQDMIQRTLGKT